MAKKTTKYYKEVNRFNKKQRRRGYGALGGVLGTQVGGILLQSGIEADAAKKWRKPSIIGGGLLVGGGLLTAGLLARKIQKENARFAAQHGYREPAKFYPNYYKDSIVAAYQRDVHVLKKKNKGKNKAKLLTKIANRKEKFKKDLSFLKYNQQVPITSKRMWENAQKERYYSRKVRKKKK